MSKYTLYCVYCITCTPIQRHYIGQTNSIRRRRAEHFDALALKSHPNKQLQYAYDLYGKNAFAFKVIERSILIENINEREKYWIDFYNSYHRGFNRVMGYSTQKSQPNKPTQLARPPLALPPRDIKMVSLSRAELAEFELIRVINVQDFWCSVGKHLYHDDNGVIYYKMIGHRNCCPKCYRYLMYDRWK